MNDTITKEQVANTALKYLGSPGMTYVNPESGMTPSGFDCSGFITYILTLCGLNVPGIRHANEYLNHYGSAVDLRHLQAGDLVFFSRNGYICDHIAMMIDSEYCIHASGINVAMVSCQRLEDVRTRFIPQIPHPTFPDAPQLYVENPILIAKRPIVSMQGRYPITLS